jgi:hypothetical protein
MQQTTFKPLQVVPNTVDSEAVQFLASYYFKHGCTLDQLEIQTVFDPKKMETPQVVQIEKFLSQLGAVLSDLPFPGQSLKLVKTVSLQLHVPAEPQLIGQMMTVTYQQVGMFLS